MILRLMRAKGVSCDRGNILAKLAVIFLCLMFSGLAADLLSLYYAGAWTDTVTLIRVVEILTLYVFSIAGIISGAVLILKFIKAVK